MNKKPAIILPPASITRLYCAENAMEGIELFARCLVEEGVPEDVVRRNAAKAKAQIPLIATRVNGRCHQASVDYFARLGDDERRKGHLARVLLSRFDGCFPKSDSESKAILTRAVEGRLPRAIIPGLLIALKQACGYSLFEEHQQKVNALAAKHTAVGGTRVNYTHLLQEPQVQESLRTIYEKLLHFYRVMGDPLQWLKRIIETQGEFARTMQRPLTDAEMRRLLGLLGEEPPDTATTPETPAPGPRLASS